MAFNLKDLIIGLIIFAAAITGMVLFAADVQDHHSTTNYSQLNTSFNKTLGSMERIQNLSDRMQDSVRGTPITGVTAVDVGISISNGVVSSLKLVFEAPTIMASILYEISDTIGIPAWVISFVLTGLALAIIFAIIAAIFRVPGV